MTHWEAFELYRCRHCGENCINRFDELVTKIGECRSCHQIADNTIDTSTTSERPSGAPPSHGGPTEGGSAPPERSEGDSSRGSGSGDDRLAADGGNR